MKITNGSEYKSFEKINCFYRNRYLICRFDDIPFDTISQNNRQNAAAGGVQNDYTIEWKHIYLAGNNLFSGICLSLFCFVIMFEIM